MSTHTMTLTRRGHLHTWTCPTCGAESLQAYTTKYAEATARTHAILCANDWNATITLERTEA